MKKVYFIFALFLALVCPAAQSSNLGPDDGLACSGRGNFKVYVSKADRYQFRRMTLVNMPTSDGGTYKYGDIVEYIRPCSNCGTGNILDNGFVYTTYFALYLDVPAIKIAAITYPLRCEITGD